MWRNVKFQGSKTSGGLNNIIGGWFNSKNENQDYQVNQ